MSITTDTVVIGVPPRITKDRFVQILRDANSPATPEAAAAYDVIVQTGVDPAFMLAIFHHESNYGHLGICAVYNTKSPGNTRSTRTGVGTVIQTEKGPFVRYPSWVEGFRDAAFRLVDPSFVYVQEGRTTIRRIIERWAPAEDNNNPNNYTNAVIRDMTAWEVPPVSDHLPIRVSFIPAGNRNRPGYHMVPQGITVHETGNPNAGANAEMHRRFVHNGGGQESVSFHWVVDDREAIQLLPHNENGWHGGDGANGFCNRNTIAIETCVNADGDWNRTLHNLTLLLVKLCKEFGWGVDRIRQHYHCSGKDCPQRLRRSGWNELIANVAARLAAPKDDGMIRFPNNPYEKIIGKPIVVGGGFALRLREVPEHLWLPMFGYPMNNEETFDFGDGYPRTIQRFERVVFGWYPRGSPDGVPPDHPFHVRVMTLNEVRRMS